MKKIFIILSISVLFFSSCVTMKQYENEVLSFAEKLDSVKEVTVTQKKTIIKLKSDTTKYIYIIDTLNNYSNTLHIEFKEVKQYNDYLKKSLDSANLDTARLFFQIDSLQKINLKLIRGNNYLRSQNKVLNKKKVSANQFTRTKILTSSTLAKRIPFRNNSFDIYVVDIKKNKLAFFWRDEMQNIYSSLGNVKKAVEDTERELLFATNAGIYKPDNSPEGLYIENGKKLIDINLKQPTGYANFYMNFGKEPRSNGIFIVTKQNKASVIKANEYKYSKNIQFATQSGPLMLRNGKINPKFNKGSRNKNIRSGVGIINSSKVVFIISNKRVNFYDFASIFKTVFGCKNALYLDGAISEMYLPKINRKELGGDFGAVIGVIK